MEGNEKLDNSLTMRNSIYDKMENLSKTGTAMQNVENYIEELQNNYHQEMMNIYQYYSNMKEVVENIIIEFPMIDVSNFNDFLTICEELFKFLKNSEKIFNLSSELNLENKKLREKIDKLNGKKILLKSKSDNLAKELNFKEYQIKKLEEDNSNLTKEYSDLNAKFQKIKENELQNITDNQEEVGHTSKNITPHKKNSIFNVHYQMEMKILTEEKNNLSLENSNLLRKLAHLENELKTKYINKNDYEQKIQMMESERNIYGNKVKNLENLCEKLQKELNVLKAGKEDLLSELEQSQKKFIELLEKSSPNNLNFNQAFYNTQTPLQQILDEDIFDDNIKEFANIRRTVTKVNREDMMNIFDSSKIEEKNKKDNKQKEDITISNFNIEDPISFDRNLEHDDQIEEKSEYMKSSHIKDKSEINLNLEMHKDEDKNKSLVNLGDILNEKKFTENSSRNSSLINQDFNFYRNRATLKDTMSENQKNEFSYISMNKENKASNKTFDKSINNKTPRSNLKMFDNFVSDTIIKFQNKNDISSDKIKSNVKFVSTKKLPLKPLKVNDTEYYKNFFMLTYQAIKLNSENVEIFDEIKPDILFKKTIDRFIPYHKFHHFIKREIKELQAKYHNKDEYNNDKFGYIINYLASKLY